MQEKRVGWPLPLPEQEPRESVVGRGVGGLRLHLGGLRAGEMLGGGDHEVDVTGVAALNSVHHKGHRSSRSGRAVPCGRKITTA